MTTLNERAWQLCDSMVADAERLGIDVHTHDCGTRLIDCGVHAQGSIEAGERLSVVCLSGLGRAAVRNGMGGAMQQWPARRYKPSEPHPRVYVHTDQPIAACLASQYAGWEIKGDGFFAMGSGPMRAAAGREELFDTIGQREKSPVCVGILETSKFPPEGVCVDLATKCGIAPDRLTLLVARTCSVAGTIQIVARSLETALHKLHVLGFELNRIVSGFGTAPLPPAADDDLVAIGLTNDAILYGAYVGISVRGDDASIEEIGPRVPSSASPDYGTPFAQIFARYDRDFYRIDPLLFSPGFVEMVNVDTGKRHEFGRLDADVLAESFGRAN